MCSHIFVEIFFKNLAAGKMQKKMKTERTSRRLKKLITIGNI